MAIRKVVNSDAKQGRLSWAASLIVPHSWIEQAEQHG
jgi:hypothetical protein